MREGSQKEKLAPRPDGGIPRCRQGEAGEDFVLIDTRNPQAWSQSDVKLPEAIRLPLMAQYIRQRGYKNAWALQGGLDAWRNAGLPLDSKPKAA